MLFLEVQTMKTKLIKTLVFTGISLIVVGGFASTITYPKAQKLSTLNLKKDIPVNENKTVIVSGDSLNIQVLESTDQQVHVEINGKSPVANKFEIKTTESNNELKIDLKEPAINRQKVRLFFDFDTKNATVYLPKNIKNTEINTKFGTISTESFNGDSLSVKSNAGDINLTNLKTKTLNAVNNFGTISLANSVIEDTNIKTNAGEVSLSRLIGKTTTVDASAGDVSLNQVTGKISAKTNAGGIDLSNKKIDQALDFQTNFGDISIETATLPTDAVIQSYLDLGDLTIFGKNEPNARFGEGKNQIKLKTNAGNIQVEQEQDSDDSTMNDMHDSNHMDDMDMDMDHMMDSDKDF